MANEIGNIENSFLQFGVTLPETCADYNGVMLPLYSANDIGCMVKILDTSEAYVEGLRFYIVRGSYNPGDVVSAGNIVAELSTFGSGLISGSDYLIWTYDNTCTGTPLSSSAYPPEDGECLRLAIMTMGNKVVLAMASQPFYYKEDTCFTNLVIYKCNENSFGFLYEIAGADFFNQMRIPLTLINPKPLTEKSGFRKSDGRFITLSATKAKEWEVEIDMLSDPLHQALDCAIDHDILYISETVVADCEYQEYYHDAGDKYDIDWKDGEGSYDGVAKARCKLKTNPYYSNNNNC